MEQPRPFPWTHSQPRQGTGQVDSCTFPFLVRLNIDTRMVFLTLSNAVSCCSQTLWLQHLTLDMCWAMHNKFSSKRKRNTEVHARQALGTEQLTQACCPLHIFLKSCCEKIWFLPRNTMIESSNLKTAIFLWAPVKRILQCSVGWIQPSQKHWSHYSVLVIKMFSKWLFPSRRKLINFNALLYFSMEQCCLFIPLLLFPPFADELFRCEDLSTVFDMKL